MKFRVERSLKMKVVCTWGFDLRVDFDEVRHTGDRLSLAAIIRHTGDRLSLAAIITSGSFCQ
jgi:hypothetical protein